MRQLPQCFQFGVHQAVIFQQSGALSRHTLLSPFPGSTVRLGVSLTSIF